MNNSDDELEDATSNRFVYLRRLSSNHAINRGGGVNTNGNVIQYGNTSRRALDRNR